MQTGFPAAFAVVPIPMTIVAGGLAAELLVALVFRLHSYYFAIGTLALATIVQLVLRQFRSVNDKSSDFYVNSPESLTVFGLGAGVVMYYVGLLVAIVAGTYWVIRSRSGLGDAVDKVRRGYREQPQYQTYCGTRWSRSSSPRCLRVSPVRSTVSMSSTSIPGRR